MLCSATKEERKVGAYLSLSRECPSMFPNVCQQIPATQDSNSETSNKQRNLFHTKSEQPLIIASWLWPGADEFECVCP